MRKFHGQNNWQVHGPRFLEGCLEGIIDVTRVVCPFGIFNFIIELYFFIDWKVSNLIVLRLI